VAIYDIEPARQRDLLQPVDRWILRFAPILEDDLPGAAVREWMALQSRKPELDNAGTWYFGARIAPQQFTYKRALRTSDFARNWPTSTWPDSEARSRHGG
jgi:hypothetical protein